MNIAILDSLTETPRAAGACWRIGGEMSWQPLTAPVSAAPTPYDLALALAGQLAQGGIVLRAESGAGQSGVVLRLKGSRAFDFVVPADSCFAALGFPYETSAATEIVNIREPLGVCVGLCVARWEKPAPGARTRCRLSLTGRVLGGRAFANQSPLVVRLSAVSAAQVIRLHDLLSRALLNDAPLLVLGLCDTNGSITVNENESWRAWPTLDEALRVIRCLTTKDGEVFDVTLKMEVTA